MTWSFPAVLRPLVPHARTVLLKPYTPLGALVVPDLGLRLLFPRRDAGSLGFAVTNPLFKAVRLGPSGLLLTVARGSHSRYCGNVFINDARFAVSLLICTTMTGRHYTSDILFRSPVPPKAPVVAPARPPLWRPLVALFAFGHNRHLTIEKRAVLKKGPWRIVVSVSRFLVDQRTAVLGFSLRNRHGKAPFVSQAALYQGRTHWRVIASHLACRAVVARPQVRCALVIARPVGAISRWHLVVVTSAGTARVSW